jgi:hypothetical protein
MITRRDVDRSAAASGFAEMSALSLLKKRSPLPNLNNIDSSSGEIGIGCKDRVDALAVGCIDDDHRPGVVGEGPGHSDDALAVQGSQMAAVGRTCCQTLRGWQESQVDDPHAGRLSRSAARRCIS